MQTDESPCAKHRGKMQKADDVSPRGETGLALRWEKWTMLRTDPVGI